MVQVQSLHGLIIFLAPPLFVMDSCRHIEQTLKRRRWRSITSKIFLDKKNSKYAKNIQPSLRVWAKIILGCICQKPSTKTLDNINVNEKVIACKIILAKDFPTFYLARFPEINPSIIKPVFALKADYSDPVVKKKRKLSKKYIYDDAFKLSKKLKTIFSKEASKFCPKNQNNFVYGCF
ncbi:unnamed protein product [Vicia faba]|uniref:Uncharacterized protein n=1 Tax=Vicia faba TaxID=3906 RepID=A0AAV0ZLS3_VICFA|nr:unnamed protein product [Vicia faba]